MAINREPFTYPFCYVPHPLVVDAARALCDRIDADPELKALFAEGKMLGVLLGRAPDGRTITLEAFSGLVSGHACLPGFVPPIFDYSAPEGYFRQREAEISAMPAGPDRHRASAELQDWLFRRYVVRNARGEQLDVKEIFAQRGLVPPGGTGDCAAPRLLQEAYRQGLQPLAMGECWYGAPPKREVRAHGRFYPSCTGKCGPLLTWMMQGLEVAPNPLDAGFPAEVPPRVIYEDADLLVTVKPSGMLSVPGRTSAPSLLGWLRERYGEVHSCHRLDMDTSGLMVFARNLRCQALMETAFAERQVQKEYRARLVAGSPWKRPLKGTIALPLAPDWEDRPRQMVDECGGKPALTDYEVLHIFPDGEVEVLFRPRTGRTHQLRVHAAHQQGLGRPIKGDRLYGCPDAGRLWLHACRLSFPHPASGEQLTFCD